MTGSIIRKATEADISEVMRINVETLPENYWYGFYKHLLDNWGEAFLVAEVEGKLVGYAMSRVEDQADPVLLGLATELKEEGGVLKRIVSMLKSITEPRPVGHLVSIAVREQYRRRGIGSKLLEETIRVMRDVYKTDSIYLEVRVSNIPAIRLYEKYGFKKARIIKGYYSDGEDAYVMVRRLK
ncbi:MAG: ribosomal protein S18-alanine N-acetyltransferase [Acidilobaceae archaeon]